MSALVSTSARILDVLSDVTGSDDVRNHPEIDLYGQGIIDSLATVSLMLAFEEAFGIRSPRPNSIARAGRHLNDCGRRRATNCVDP